MAHELRTPLSGVRGEVELALRDRSPDADRRTALPLAVGAGEDIVAGALHPLLENALRHAAQRVDIELAREDGEVVIAVSDDGAGIAAGDAERIFEPGVSAAGGAGLGLARRLARAAGG